MRFNKQSLFYIFCSTVALLPTMSYAGAKINNFYVCVDVPVAPIQHALHSQYNNSGTQCMNQGINGGTNDLIIPQGATPGIYCAKPVVMENKASNSCLTRDSYEMINMSEITGSNQSGSLKIGMRDGTYSNDVNIQDKSNDLNKWNLSTGKTFSKTTKYSYHGTLSNAYVIFIPSSSAQQNASL